jgi:hypothetical protein
MGLDTKTYWLTDRQSQCNFNFDFDSNKNLFLGSKWGLTQRQAGRMTVDRNIIFTLTLRELVERGSQAVSRLVS